VRDSRSDVFASLAPQALEPLQSRTTLPSESLNPSTSQTQRRCTFGFARV